MNYMGNKVVTELLDLYCKKPRLMHERVWSRLRAYEPLRSHIKGELKYFIGKSIITRERDPGLPEEVHIEIAEKPKEPVDDNAKELTYWRANRYCLTRRVIEHIAGMTDRYITNEYNRLNQAGREIERNDETYFFS